MKKLFSLFASLLMILTMACSFAACFDYDGEYAEVETTTSPVELKAARGWPSNQYTSLLPTPKGLSVDHVYNYASYCTVQVTWDCQEAAQAYGKALEAAGFTVNQQKVDGQASYLYAASNKDGYTVRVSWFDTENGTNLITVGKK